MSYTPRRKATDADEIGGYYEIGEGVVVGTNQSVTPGQTVQQLVQSVLPAVSPELVQELAKWHIKVTLVS